MIRHVLLLLFILPAIVPTPSARAETLQEFAAKCDQAMGGSAFTVPDFDCDDPLSTEVPFTNAFDSNGNGIALEYELDPYGNLAIKNGNFHALYEQLGQLGRCDRPDRLNQECDPGSRFRVLVNKPEVYIVAHCRKKGNSGTLWGDIAVIQHNRKTGATCFYQEGPQTGLKNHVIAPADPSGGEWNSPNVAASQSCVSCHDNGPVIRSPYLTQLKGPNTLPGADDTCSTPDCATFNRDPQRYSFVGSDFASWKAYKVEITGNTCNNCHRMGVSNQDSGGTSRDFGIRATQQQPEHGKNVHSLASPIWMIPNQITFNQQTWEAALAIRDCANKFNENMLPNSDACRITQFAGAYNSLDIATLIGLIQIPLR
jgi:hypothetical protein